MAACVAAASQVQAQQTRLVDEGRRIFFEETFNGNGRTCGTCHPVENSLTIDPAFIATLSPAELAILRADAVPGLEAPNLIVQGLVLENLDGLPDPLAGIEGPPPVFRGVPHTLGMRFTTERDPTSGLPHAAATGWSGDGSPFDPTRSLDGGLRDFAVGAVIQHFTKTLNRVPGTDFRLPTEDELDALLAFQLSTSPRRTLDIDAVAFTDPAAETGADLFSGVGVNRACTACHGDAGALNGSGVNANFNTGVANLPTPATNVDDGDGTGAFNTPSLLEAADTGPFFHNNAAATIEDAVRFYRTDTFAQSPTGNPFGGRFQLSDGQVLQVGAFLRAVNAATQADNAAGFLQAARRPQARDRLLRMVVADTGDCIEVLTTGPIQLGADAIPLLTEAQVILNPLVGRPAQPGDVPIMVRAGKLLRDASDLIMLDGQTQVAAGP